MFSKIKNHWNYISDSPEDTKIFSKEWFVFVLMFLGVLGVIALLVLICHFLKIDAVWIIQLIAFAGFSFLAGFIYKLNRDKTKNKP